MTGFVTVSCDGSTWMSAASSLNTDIIFLIPVPDWRPEEATPLQGFSLSLCYNAELIRATTLLPSNIYDLTPEGQETLLARRICGTNPVHWYPQSPRALTSTPVPAFTPFTIVLLGRNDNPEEYATWAQSADVPPVIVAGKGGDLTYEELNSDGLRRVFLERCHLIPKSIDPEAVRHARDAIENWRPKVKRGLEYQVGSHGSVMPNLMALTAAGFVDLVYGPFKKIGEGSQAYVNQIVKTAHSIFDERGRVGRREAERSYRPPPDLNLFAPTIYPHFFSARLSHSLADLEKRRLSFVRNALQRQSGYNFDISSDAQVQALFGIDRSAISLGNPNPQPHPLLLLRCRELELSTECIGALAAGEMSAVLRLPNDINRTDGIVRQFAEHYRGANTHSKIKKRVQAFRKIKTRLAQAFPADFYELIDRSQEGIRIISNAHLEWLDVGGLPLAIRKNVSRIPVTPGNLFVDQLGARPPLRLIPEDFKDILVINALARDDPIRPYFEAAFGLFGREWKDRTKVQFVEVSSESQLVSALNEFEGPLVIFDGHGSHEADKPAHLHLMGSPIDIWELRGKLVRPPPIVVLSACDTHAADRNHATTASGFLALGSRAVLGSVFPLLAHDAAIFAARLVYRVSTFVPAAVDLFGRSLTWLEVVSGMLRMQLLTDLLRILETKNIISQEVCLDVHQMGNRAINGGHKDPFAEVIRLLQSSGVDESVIKHELAVAVATSSVISYLNMGRPETILLDTKERFERHTQQLCEMTITSSDAASLHS